MISGGGSIQLEPRTDITCHIAKGLLFSNLKKGPKKVRKQPPIAFPGASANSVKKLVFDELCIHT